MCETTEGRARFRELAHTLYTNWIQINLQSFQINFLELEQLEQLKLSSVSHTRKLLYYSNPEENFESYLSAQGIHVHGVSV